MPKDATKNVDRYKIRGGQLNEFDFHQNQEAYVAEATKSTKDKKGTKAITGATAKKLAARKAAKKK
jgi:hypothetical protein